MKKLVKILIITFIALSLTGCYAKRKVQSNVYVEPQPVEETEEIDATAAAYTARIEGIVNYAMEFLGRPYVYGAEGPDSFDCSGFTKYVYENIGISLSRVAASQFKNGVEIRDKRELKRGDLVFFKGHDLSDDNIGHVGIVLEADNDTGHFSFIHVSLSDGVTISKSTSEYYRKRYLTACRLIF